MKKVTLSKLAGLCAGGVLFRTRGGRFEYVYMRRYQPEPFNEDARFANRAARLFVVDWYDANGTRLFQSTHAPAPPEATGPGRTDERDPNQPQPLVQICEEGWSSASRSSLADRRQFPEVFVQQAYEPGPRLQLMRDPVASTQTPTEPVPGIAASGRPDWSLHFTAPSLMPFVYREYFVERSSQLNRAAVVMWPFSQGGRWSVQVLRWQQQPDDEDVDLCHALEPDCARYLHPQVPEHPFDAADRELCKNLECDPPLNRQYPYRLVPPAANGSGQTGNGEEPHNKEGGEGQ